MTEWVSCVVGLSVVTRERGSDDARGPLISQWNTSWVKMPVASLLKAPADFQYIGADAPRIDALAKATGPASFGIDADLPGMVYAVVVRPPVAGSKALKYDDSAARSAPGTVRSRSGRDARLCAIAMRADSHWRVQFQTKPNSL